jgi:topoisomerase-4 subunit B
VISKDFKIADLLSFYMGKNTPERQDFIIDNLRIEKDLVKDLEVETEPELLDQ